MVVGSSGVVRVGFSRFSGATTAGGAWLVAVGKRQDNVEAGLPVSTTWPGGRVGDTFGRGWERHTVSLCHGGGNFWVVAHPSCVQWQPLQLCSGTLVQCRTSASRSYRRWIPHSHTQASLGALTVVQFMDDPGWSHERVWTWLAVTRSEDVCGCAVYTPRGDEHVEALADCSFYAQITRVVFASRKGGWRRAAISRCDLCDEMPRLTRVGWGLAEVLQAAMGCPGADVDLKSCYNFFQERLVLPQTGWLVRPRRRLGGHMSEVARAEQMRTRPRRGVLPLGSGKSSRRSGEFDESEGRDAHSLVAEGTRAHDLTMGCAGSWDIESPLAPK